MFGRRLWYVVVKDVVVVTVLMVLANDQRHHQHHQPMRGLEVMITTIEIETEVGMITVEGIMTVGIIMIRDEIIIMALVIPVMTEMQTEDALMIMDILQKGSGGDEKTK